MHLPASRPNLSHLMLTAVAILFPVAALAWSWTPSRSAPLRPVALVYRGPGACEENCSELAALMAQKAGLQTVFVGPHDDPHRYFGPEHPETRLWIQPGGKSTTVAETMDARLKDAIRELVRAGGGYVGFCAGGFFATAQVGQSQVEGLGLVPGESELYAQVPDDAIVLPLNWRGSSRQIYWEGGPFFRGPVAASGPHVLGAGFETTAIYADGTAASVRGPYGLGRVYVTGAHPEASTTWRTYNQLTDSDGVDFDLAIDMIRWVQGL